MKLTRMEIRTLGNFVFTGTCFKNEGSTNNEVPMDGCSLSEGSTDLMNVLSLKDRT